jgi:4-diphosphocytidyl-2C-methyl-D-erythritol kinase
LSAPQDPARRLAPVVRLAPAKLNLTLAVLGTRPDGYHELHSIMVPLDLADRLSVAVLATGAADSLHVAGFDPGPAGDNLVLRAFAAARRHAQPVWGRSEPPPALAARLDKRIPVAAGLAGGSSDAAAAVDAAPGAWSWTRTPVIASPRSWVRMCRSSWQAVPPWWRVVASA